MKTLILWVLVNAFHFANAQEAPGQYPFTTLRLVTDDDLKDKTLTDLRIMRNEIFARHGHTFKSEELKNHFNSQPWYKSTIADATAQLTEMEKKNVDFIKRFENKIAATADFDDFYNLFTKAVEAGDVDKLKGLVLYKEMIDSPEQFEQSYSINVDDIVSAVENGGKPEGDETVRKLFYGEFYNGVQYQWIQFQKQGCCWYIYAFFKAG